MDSDRDASSGSESEPEINSKGPRSPSSGRSSQNSYAGSPLSRSRSNSPSRLLRSRSRSPRNRNRSPRSPTSGPRTPSSTMTALNLGEFRNSRPQTPKSPDSITYRSSRPPAEGNHSEGPRSPSPANSSRSISSKSRSNSRSSKSRSLSSKSRSSSPKSRSVSPKSRSSSRRSRSNSPGSRSNSPSGRTDLPKNRSKSPKSHSSSLRSNSSKSRSNTPKSRSNTPNSQSISPQCSSTSQAGNKGQKNGLPESSKSPRTNNYSNADGHSTKSDSSRCSKKSSPDRTSVNSEKSMSSRGSRAAHVTANLDDGNTSDSSEFSVDSSSRKNKDVNKNADTQPEEISDGDMESDHEKLETQSKNKEPVNITHDDLSDVSDLDSIGCHSDDEQEEIAEQQDKEKVEESKNESEPKKVPEKTSRTEDGEEQLDFEAEDGECAEPDAPKEKDERDKGNDASKLLASEELNERAEDKEPEELEEGEVTDEDEARPEETEPRPVCRFFSRGQCTWGASCRFLHPGVTDKGNYTMFELIRPVVPGEYGRDDRMYGNRPDPPLVESAWERGLRTAKEMLRKSIKRKEQDIDFEEKKMNLSLAQEELDKENGYYARAPSPEPRYVVRHPVVPADYPPPVMRPAPVDEYYGRRQVLYEPAEYVAPRERGVRSYRELPPHRMPDYYSSKYEEEQAQTSAKARRPKREVIVQRVQEERQQQQQQQQQQGRGDEWSDPWMRSKSPGARKGRKRSYSSGSSYSSSSTSRSSSGSTRSSYRSRSRSPRHRRDSRGGAAAHRGGGSGAGRREAVSPSVIVSERKAANERAALMNPPAPRKRAPSPGMMRAGAQNPPAPPKVDPLGRRGKLAIAAAIARVKGRRRSSRSSSDSSGSSSSDSDSSGSSSSSSREGSPLTRRTAGVDLAMALKAKAIDALKGGTEKKQIKLNLKNPVTVTRKPEPEIRKPDLVAKKRPASSPPPIDPKNASNKKATSRREELLKQLKAVEDAIAKKRSKV